MPINNLRKKEWDEWIQRNEKNMKHVVNFERRFVEEILINIEEINPRDLISQYAFHDQKGGIRYIDFVILNKTLGIRLAIELDGYSKIQSYQDFQNLLDRQNGLITELPFILLRYANKKWLTEKNAVINEIKAEVHREIKEKQFSDEEKIINNRKDKEILNLKEELQTAQFEFSKLRLKLSNAENAQKELKQELVTKSEQNKMADFEKTELDIQQLKNELDKILHVQTTLQEQLNNVINKRDHANKNIFVKLIIFILCIGISIFIYTKYIHDTTIEKVENQTKDSDNKLLSHDLRINSNIDKSNDLESKHNDNVNELLSKNAILASDSINYVGETKIVCGTLAQFVNTKNTGKKSYMNFDAKYPNQTFTAVIDDIDLNNFLDITGMIGNRICLQGQIVLYKSKPQLLLKNKSQWIR